MNLLAWDSELDCFEASTTWRERGDVGDVDGIDNVVQTDIVLSASVLSTIDDATPKIATFFKQGIPDFNAWTIFISKPWKVYNINF